MFCKKCGKEVDNDSLFCSFCGAELKNSNESKEDNAIITETDKKYVERPKKDNGDKIFLIIFLSVVAFLIIVALIAFSKDSNDGETSTSYNSQKYNSVQLSDIIVSFERKTNYFESDDYFMYIQAQEKIEGLKLLVTFKDSKGQTLKSETINIGKIVPGNHYKFELSQTGVNPSDVDKTEKFSYEIVSGKTVD